MDSLAEIVKREIGWYAAGDTDLKMYVLFNEADQVYAVNRVIPSRRWPTDVVMLARIVGDYVIIEDDRTDKPFEDRLTAAGIPRAKIVLAYAGEILPDTQPQP
jgi:hypothetical protein